MMSFDLGRGTRGRGTLAQASWLLAGMAGLLALPCAGQMGASDSTAAPTAMAGAMQAGSAKVAVRRSEMLTLSVAGRSVQLTAEAMARLPQTSLTVLNAHTKQQETYRGVALGDLLASAGLPFAGHEQQIYRSYVRAQGTDFYFVLFSAGEVEAAMHNGNVIVATEINGQPLGADGRFKLVASEDKRPARWVRNLDTLTLVTVN